jgi:HAE1 family hydrophobic/amphiphilic exporter-1
VWLTRLAIHRPLVIWMALAAIAVLGIIAYNRLPAELNPRTDIPTLTVTTFYPGAGPQEIETLITRPLEDAVGAVGGLRDVFSSSQESVSILSMDFAIGTDLDRAVASVREKVDAARAQLPTEARAPIVAKLDINAQPVYYVSLTSPGPIQELWQDIDSRLRPQLARVPGVAAVSVVGGLQREIRVAVDSLALTRYGLTIEDVVSSVKAANQNVPAGTIVLGPREIGVRTLAAYTSLDEIRQAPILSSQQSAVSSQGRVAGRRGVVAPLTVADVATVSDSTADPATITRVNGRESVSVVVTKGSDANTLSVVAGVKERLAAMKGALPAGTETFVARDDSIVVRDALDDVNATLILGAILAMAIVFLFLHNLRGTLIVALALPACLVATFLVMYFAGFTLNQMTLLALSLSVGILIDDSIVVLESITRHLGLGEAPEEAAFNGRTEIGFADITTTLADVVVFLPIAFMGGIVGAFFRQFGLTIVVATLFSLIVSFTVTPSLAARWYRQGENPEAATRGFFGRLERIHHAVERLYRRVLRLALANRWWVVAAGAVILVAALLVTIPSLGTELLPATDQGQILIAIEAGPDASLAATDAIARLVEARLGGVADVRNVSTTVGEILGGFGEIPQRGSRFAQINVRLTEKVGVQDQVARLGGTPPGMRSRDDNVVAADIRRRLKDVAGARITVTTVRSVASTGAPIQVQLRGDNLQDLARAAEDLKARLQQMRGILDPDVSLRIGRPEVQVRIDRVRAAALGVPAAQAGAALRDAVEGNADSTFRQGGTEIPIRVQVAGADRRNPETLRDIPVAMGAQGVVTLGQVATLDSGAGPAAIDRINGQRMVTVSAQLAPDYPAGNAQADIQKQLDAMELTGIEAHFGGEAEAMGENMVYFAMALGLAVVLVYLVMASLFNSLLNPFIIMFTLPMALVGALGALAITGGTISLVSMIGIIMLTGLMGRNAILLIDYTGTLRARGMERDEAVAEAGATRLRPILMTTLATIFGMLPVALRIGRASELRAPMAIVVIGGLLLSTVLTLVVIPVLYTLFDDLVNRKKPATDGLRGN